MGVIINTKQKKRNWVLIDTEVVTSVTTVSKTITADLSQYTEFMVCCGYGGQSGRIDESTILPSEGVVGVLQTNSAYQGNITQSGYIEFVKSSNTFRSVITWLRSGNTVTQLTGYLFAR